MKVACLLSGGKDSLFSFFLVKHYSWDISCFITIDSKNKSSYLFHTPKISKTKEIADSLRIPLIIQETKGEKEDELDDLRIAIKKAIQEYQIEGIVVGAIKSEYQRIRMNEVCYENNIKFFAPMWHKDEKTLLQEMIHSDFKIVFSGIFAYGLNTNMLGKEIDYKILKELEKINEKMQISFCGEGGEYESLVIDMPDYLNPIDISNSKKEIESDIVGFLVD